MNTPAHLIFAATVFGDPDRGRITVAALAGGLVPDLSLYLLAGWHLQVLGTPPGTVFGTLYYSDTWQAIFRIDNSFVLWGLALVAALAARMPVAIAFCAAALLHLTLDFPLHNDDARAHFWPLTDWIFISPVSYWDPAHHGTIVGMTEVAAALACCVLLWRRFTGRWMRGLVALLAVLQLAPGIAYALMFAGP